MEKDDTARDLISQVIQEALDGKIKEFVSEEIEEIVNERYSDQLHTFSGFLDEKLESHFQSINSTYSVYWEEWMERQKNTYLSHMKIILDSFKNHIKTYTQQGNDLMVSADRYEELVIKLEKQWESLTE